MGYSVLSLWRCYSLHDLFDPNSIFVQERGKGKREREGEGEEGMDFSLPLSGQLSSGFESAAGRVRVKRLTVPVSYSYSQKLQLQSHTQCKLPQSHPNQGYQCGLCGL